jgi:glutamate synthase (NADPH/NADH) large chain
MAMIELEPIPEEEELSQRTLHQAGDMETSGLVEIMTDLTSRDAERLRALIVRHRRFTGSKRAAEILENWSTYLPKFRKVMPVEYRRALAELQAAQEQAEPMRLAGE